MQLPRQQRAFRLERCKLLLFYFCRLPRQSLLLGQVIDLAVCLGQLPSQFQNLRLHVLDLLLLLMLQLLLQLLLVVLLVTGEARRD